VYEDEMSGAKTRRPGLDRLMEDARLHRFDAVVVWKLDRFGRSVIDLVGSPGRAGVVRREVRGSIPRDRH